MNVSASLYGLRKIEKSCGMCSVSSSLHALCQTTFHCPLLPFCTFSNLQADKLIKEEMVRLLQSDAVKYPVAPVGGRQAPRMDQLSDVDLAKVCVCASHSVALASIGVSLVPGCAVCSGELVL